MLSYNEIKQLCELGVVEGYKELAINSTSLDIHLGPTILVERGSESGSQVVDYRARERLNMVEVTIPEGGYCLRPGEFILAHSEEIFHLPNNIDAEYYLKSSMARIGLENLHAGHCDPGWHGSTLTLELKNMTQFHTIRLRTGDPIGQMLFFQVTPVPDSKSYKSVGRYNNDKSVSGIKV